MKRDLGRGKAVRNLPISDKFLTMPVKNLPCDSDFKNYYSESEDYSASESLSPYFFNFSLRV